MANNAIAKISKRAKQLTAANKKLAWKDAIQKASAEYRGGKLGTVKKVAGVKKPAKVGSVKTAVKRAVKSAKAHYALHKQNKAARLKETCKSIGAVKTEGLAILGNQYAKLAVQKAGVTGVREGKKIGKAMTTIAGKMRKLKSL